MSAESQKTSPNYLAFFVMLALFFAECEFLLRTPVHHEVRKALRALIGVPAHDILFAALVFLALAKALLKAKIPEPVGLRFSSGFLLVHLAYTLCLENLLLPLHALFPQLAAKQNIYPCTEHNDHVLINVSDGPRAALATTTRSRACRARVLRIIRCSCRQCITPG